MTVYCWGCTKGDISCKLTGRLESENYILNILLLNPRLVEFFFTLTQNLVSNPRVVESKQCLIQGFLNVGVVDSCFVESKDC